jgi:hypothetical protein
MNWIIKKIWLPLKYLVNRILGNHLVQGFLSYFSFRLLETQEANKVLANVMMYFAITAFGLYILEKFGDIHTPFIRVGNMFKSFRHSNTLENPKRLEKSIRTTFEEGEKFYYFIKKKGLSKYMKKFINALTYIFKANPKTSAGNVAVLGFYAAIGDLLIEKYHFTFANYELVSKWFFILFGLATLGSIIGLFAVNGGGLETLTKWIERINHENLNKLVDELIGLSVKAYPDQVKLKLKEAYELLDKVKPYIREVDHNGIKQKLDMANLELKRLNASKVLEQEKERQELLEMAQQMQQSEHPQDNIKIHQ